MGNAPELTPADVETAGWLIFKCISGSRAYGTHSERSDLDYRGVFVAPPEQFYGLHRLQQVSDETNDTTYYELGRFFELLSANNPNILELLYMPEDCVLLSDSLFEQINPGLFLSKLCRQTFAGYALSQVHKARGLNKKIVNPMPGQRKAAVDFCHVLDGQGAIPLERWLERRAYRQEDCGLVKVPHMRDIYGIFHDPSRSLGYRGIFASREATEIRCSSIPRGKEPVGWMAFNKDGFKKHCREYRAYWDWVEQRNEERYATNIEHGKNYDSKNLMHTIRLLDVAREIATEHRIAVRRPNREELLRIRKGEFTYEDLVARAERMTAEIEPLFDASNLPERPDPCAVNALLVRLRSQRYQRK